MSIFKQQVNSFLSLRRRLDASTSECRLFVAARRRVLGLHITFRLMHIFAKCCGARAQPSAHLRTTLGWAIGLAVPPAAVALCPLLSVLLALNRGPRVPTPAETVAGWVCCRYGASLWCLADSPRLPARALPSAAAATAIKGHVTCSEIDLLASNSLVCHLTVPFPALVTDSTLKQQRAQKKA